MISSMGRVLRSTLKGLLGFFDRKDSLLEMEEASDPVFEASLSASRERPMKDFLRLVPTLGLFPFVSSWLSSVTAAFSGEEDREAEDIHDFRRSFDNDLAGERDFAPSMLLRLGRDGTLLSAAFDSSLRFGRRKFPIRDVLRDALMFNSSMGASFSGLVPPEEVSSPLLGFDSESSSSEILPFSSTTELSSNSESFTRGKYV